MHHYQLQAVSREQGHGCMLLACAVQVTLFVLVTPSILCI